MEPEKIINQGVIRIDKEGNWFYNDLPIINETIFRLFNESIEPLEDGGGYILRIGEETCPLEVEDTPFVVASVWFSETAVKGESCFVARLNDGTEERFALETLHIGAENVPYCRVKDGSFPARLLRSAWNKLMPYIEEEEGAEQYFILLNEKKFYIKNAG